MYRCSHSSRILVGAAIAVCALMAEIENADTARDPGIDTVVSMMRSIETASHGMETAFTFHIDVFSGEELIRTDRKTRAVWRVDSGRVAGTEKLATDMLGRHRQRFWTGQRSAAIPEQGDAMAINWYFGSFLPSCPALFNQCAGYTHLCSLGLPYAVRHALTHRIEEHGDEVTVHYAEGSNRRARLTLISRPVPRYSQWVVEQRAHADAPWQKYAEYRVMQWHDYDGHVLAKRASCEFLTQGEDGEPLRVEHVFERESVRIERDQTIVDSWFVPALEDGFTVVDSLSNVKWQVGDSILLVDNWPYDVGMAIREDPTEQLASLIARAIPAGANTQAGD